MALRLGKQAVNPALLELWQLDSYGVDDRQQAQGQQPEGQGATK